MRAFWVMNDRSHQAQQLIEGLHISLTDTAVREASWLRSQNACAPPQVIELEQNDRPTKCQGIYAATQSPWKFHRRCPTRAVQGFTTCLAAAECPRLLVKTITDIVSLSVRSAANRFLPVRCHGRSTVHHCCLNVA